MTSLKKGARRVSLRLEATPESVEAKLLNHIKEDPITPSRAVMLRALRAFYLPWAMEGELSEADLRSLAQSAIEELQFRVFQIRQRYLTDEAPVYKASSVSRPVTNGAAAHVPPPREIAIGDFRQSINPADLDDF
ncbi:MAG: hypothetical protein ACFBSF_21820 [Leptolyngbyaceae cyanobacterium]